MQNFDTKKFYLGSLCKRGHDYENTGKSLHCIAHKICKQCVLEYSQRSEIKKRAKEYRNRPEIKKRQKEYQKEYYKKPEAKKRKAKYNKKRNQRSEVKEYCKKKETAA